MPARPTDRSTFESPAYRLDRRSDRRPSRASNRSLPRWSTVRDEDVAGGVERDAGRLVTDGVARGFGRRGDVDARQRVFARVRDEQPRRRSFATCELDRAYVEHFEPGGGRERGAGHAPESHRRTRDCTRRTAKGPRRRRRRRSLIEAVARLGARADLPDAKAVVPTPALLHARNADAYPRGPRRCVEATQDAEGFARTAGRFRIRGAIGGRNRLAVGVARRFVSSQSRPIAQPGPYPSRSRPAMMIAAHRREQRGAREETADEHGGSGTEEQALRG